MKAKLLLIEKNFWKSFNYVTALKSIIVFLMLFFSTSSLFAATNLADITINGNTTSGGYWTFASGSPGTYTFNCTSSSPILNTQIYKN